MGVLVLALALTNDKERYLAKTIDYLNAILEEWTWCVPAHMSWNARSRSPEEHYQSDLFASETGAELALAVNVAGCLLDEDWPGLTGRIRETVLARTVRNPLSIETVWKNSWMHGEVPGNWTPWCSTNLIIAALVLEQDRQRLSEAVQAYLKGVSRFAWYYPDDGYCMEGPTYYGVAAGNLYRLCNVFERVVPGSMEKFCRHPKNRAIFEFVAGLFRRRRSGRGSIPELRAAEKLRQRLEKRRTAADRFRTAFPARVHEERQQAFRLPDGAVRYSGGRGGAADGDGGRMFVFPGPPGCIPLRCAECLPESRKQRGISQPQRPGTFFRLVQRHAADRRCRRRCLYEEIFFR